MTAQEIADRLTAADLTRDRLLKLTALCQRSNVSVQTVISLLPEDVQQSIKEIS